MWVLEIAGVLFIVIGVLRAVDLIRMGAHVWRY